MKNIRVLLFIAAPFVFGILIGGVLSGGVLKNTSANRAANDLVTNPVVTYFTVEGKVISNDKDSILLEKDGKQLKVYLQKDSTFSKVGTSLDSKAPLPPVENISELPVGSQVIGGAILKTDPTDKQMKLYATNFLLR